MLRNLALVLLVALAAGCSDNSSLVGYLADFQGRLTGDLSELDGDLVRVAEQAADQPEQAGRDEHEPECVGTAGDCMLCFGVDGGPLNGTFEIDTDPAPCGITSTSPRGLTATYTVAESLLSGTYSGTLAGDYEMTASGTRAASLSVETSRSGTEEYDASYEITELTATTEGGELDTYSIAMTYSAFDDRVWTVNLEGTTTGLLGTVASPGGVACSIDGSFDDVQVACTGPEAE